MSTRNSKLIRTSGDELPSPGKDALKQPLPTVDMDNEAHAGLARSGQGHRQQKIPKCQRTFPDYS